MSAPEPVAPVTRALIPKTIVAVALAVLALIAVVLAGARYGVLLPQARVLIEARTDGLRVGRMGKLKLEGLSGDLWRDLTIRRLTIRDEKGVWLEALNVHLTWRYTQLLSRNFHADRIEAEAVRVLRRPTLTAKTKDTGLPVSFHIDAAHARVEMLPAFSYRRGVYDLDLNLDVERKGGGGRGKVRAASVLIPGDHLNLDFDVANTRPLVLLADAEEVRGGALAGALGLPSNQPFSLKVAAGGKVSEGRFTAVAASGAAEPLRAQGAWTPDGGVASGRISLTASTLTSGYAARLGPEASFVLAGRKAGPELFALDGRVSSQNLNLAAKGFGDLGKRTLGPQGLAIAATAGSLSRITGGPAMGPARIAGRLSALKPGWRFAGSAAVSRLDVGAYSLAQATGPVELTVKKGEWALRTRLNGAGGRGAGYAAAILGGAPWASFDGSRLADGRLLMRSLQVKGQGLEIEASGGRGLLGGLTFKGKAGVSNLAAARAGAAGAANATWSAGQARAGAPWAFSLDARGERLATGYGEIDRLLGPRPQLRAQANLQGRRLSVGSASLEGAAAKASMAGLLNPDGALAFKLDWSASGPFHAGPVEITGKARGSGAVTGTLLSPRADLSADLDQIDVPRLPLTAAHVTLSFLRKADGSSGSAAVAAGSAFGPARARADFRFPAGGPDLTGLMLDAGGVKAQGSLSLRSNAPSAADLDVVVTHGAFLDAGKIAGAVKIADVAGGPRATLNLTAENARFAGSAFALHAARITADGPLARLPFAAQAEGAAPAGKWSVNGRGVLADAKPGYLASFEASGKLGGRDLRTTEPATVRFGGPERSARVRLAASDGGRIDLDGRLTDTTADIRAQAAGLGLRLLDEDLDGKADATVLLQGRGGTLDGTLDAKLTGARGRGAPAASGIDGVVNGRLTGDTLTLDLAASNGQGLKSSASVVLPAEASAAPFRVAIARQRPLRGRFAAEGEVRPLWDLLIGGERSLAGRVKTEGAISGTLADPGLSGQITVADGRFDDGATGLSLRQVALSAAFAQNTINVTQASGVDGHGGSAAGSGRISLLQDGASTFRLDLKSFRLIDNEQAVASASGQATIDRGADGKVRLAGALTIDRADVAPDLPIPSGVVAMDVIERNRPPELAPALRPQRRDDGWALDVSLKAPRRVFLRGRGLDVELSLDAHVGGTTGRTNLTGTARVVRGDYDFAGKRFEFDPQSIVYLSNRPTDLRLDLTATRDDPTLAATVRIKGTAAKPEITLTSTPSLPSDEVLSQVLFGRSASQLSALEAAQLASALSSLAGGGGFDVVGNLRAFARLDRLALGGGDASGVTVSGGKYITDDVYLELTGGGREGPSATVEWRIRKNLSILSRLVSQGDGRLAIRWRRDY